MEEERKVITLNIDDILPNRFQPRIQFNEQAINELAESIKLHGVIQPIVVRKISDKYEIIAGERRYKASIIAGKTTIPAIVTTLDDKNSAEVALIENVQRQDLTPIEEAISYKKILDMGYINQVELGTKLGKKQSTIANKLRLLNLDDEVQEALMENKISERHARSLLKLDNKNQVLMLHRIINERLTVRRTDEEIIKLLNSSNEGNQKEIIDEKGEINMNNDILKDFNIPTEPIVNDNDSIVFEEEPKQPEVVQSIGEVPTVNSQPEVTPVVPTPQPIEQPIPPLPEIQPVTPQPEAQPIPEVAPQVDVQPVTPVDNNINPGFMDVDKIQSVAQDIIKEPEPVANMDELLRPAVQQSVQVEQPIAEVEPQPEVQTGKFFNMFNFNLPEEKSVENIENKQTNMDFGEPSYNNTFNPIIEDNSMNVTQSVSPLPEIQSVTPQPEVQPISEVAPQVDVQPVTPVVEQSLEPDVQPTPFDQVSQPAPLTDDNTFTQTQQPTMNQEITRPYMMDDSFKFDEEGEIQVQLPNQNEDQVMVDMKTVINTIRDCARTIEKYGYRVDTDEIDLADSYEVTFRIEKN